MFLYDATGWRAVLSLEEGVTPTTPYGRKRGRGNVARVSACNDGQGDAGRRLLLAASR